MASNFFSKISEKRNHKKHQKDEFGVSMDGHDKSCTPSVSSEKIMETPQHSGSQKSRTTPVKNSTRKTTPVKTVINKCAKGSPPSEMISSKIMPNLRLEAKTTAEENSRIFAGKEMHPFFSSWKGAKRCREITEPDNHRSLPDRTEAGGVSFGPIHVSERSSGEGVPLNWREWIFYENCSINLNCGLEGSFLPDVGESVQPLSFDNFSGKGEGTTLIGQSVLGNGQTDGASNGNSIDNCLRPFQIEETLPRRERIQVDSSNELGYELWANKYVPLKAEEVCGNADSVKFLNEWLCFWYNKDPGAPDGSFKSNSQSLYEADCCWSETGSDSSSTDDGDRPQNVLLITGPAGCGKSAAIYACAKEQGFQILEINTSDWRNGAHVKLRIGEALESHSVKWTLENSTCSQAKDVKRALFRSVFSDESESRASDRETVQPLPLSDAVGPTNLKPTSTDSKVHGDQDDRILILFEDVDVVFDEDRGFISAVVQLAETTKRPMILTSNCETPSLPHSLSSLHISFHPPSHSELLTLFCKVCAAQSVDVQPQLLRRFIHCCKGDMRKAMTQFQFWSLFTNDDAGLIVPEMHFPPLFGADSGHRLFPEIMPWGLPSRLAQLVEQEISKSLHMEETCDGFDLAGEGLFRQAESQRNLRKSDEVKEPTLTLDGGLFDCSGRDVAFSERVPEPSVSLVSYVADTIKNDDVRELGGTMYSLSADGSSGRALDVPIGQLYGFDTNALHSCSHPFPGTENGSVGPDRSMSADVSYVPESLFLPGAESQSGTLPHASNLPAEVSSGDAAVGPANFADFFRFLEGSGATRGPTQQKDPDPEEDEVGDSQFENTGVASSGYHIMDECSRVGFGGMLKPAGGDPTSRTAPDPVGRAWGRLRARGKESRMFVCDESDRSRDSQSSRIVRITSEMSSLFSEADVFSRRHVSSLGSGEYSEAGVPPEDQRRMTSATTEHGFCYYVKHLHSRQPELGAAIPSLDSPPEMMAERPLGSNRTGGTSCSWDNFEPSKRGDDLTRLQHTVRSVAPKAYMSLKGIAVQEYLSTLKSISKSEASRLSDNRDGMTRKRSRVAPHYLVSGDLMVSTEDISWVSARFQQ